MFVVLYSNFIVFWILTYCVCCGNNIVLNICKLPESVPDWYMFITTFKHRSTVVLYALIYIIIDTATSTTYGHMAYKKCYCYFWGVFKGVPFVWRSVVRRRVRQTVGRTVGVIWLSVFGIISNLWISITPWFVLPRIC